jgi:hypothetical protein
MEKEDGWLSGATMTDIEIAEAELVMLESHVDELESRMKIMRSTLHVADVIIEGHLTSRFSSAESIRQLTGVREAIKAALT